MVCIDMSSSPRRRSPLGASRDERAPLVRPSRQSSTVGGKTIISGNVTLSAPSGQTSEDANDRNGEDNLEAEEARTKMNKTRYGDHPEHDAQAERKKRRCATSVAQTALHRYRLNAPAMTGKADEEEQSAEAKPRSKRDPNKDVPAQLFREVPKHDQPTTATEHGRVLEAPSQSSGAPLLKASCLAGQCSSSDAEARMSSRFWNVCASGAAVKPCYDYVARDDCARLKAEFGIFKAEVCGTNDILHTSVASKLTKFIEDVATCMEETKKVKEQYEHLITTLTNHQCDCGRHSESESSGRARSSSSGSRRS